MLTKYEAIIATATVSASGAKSFLASPARSTTGRSTAIVVSVDASTGSATAFVPFERRLRRAHPHALVAMDRLEHDDGVVDEAPHRERQPAERERVERLPGRVEDDERDRERERNRDRDDERAADALEEEQDDERDEDERLDDLLLEPVVGAAHERRLIEVDLRLHARRQVLQALDDLLHRVDDLDRVAARDAQDVEVDGVLAVDRTPTASRACRRLRRARRRG